MFVLCLIFFQWLNLIFSLWLVLLILFSISLLIFIIILFSCFLLLLGTLDCLLFFNIIMSFKIYSCESWDCRCSFTDGILSNRRFLSSVLFVDQLKLWLQFFNLINRKMIQSINELFSLHLYIISSLSFKFINNSQLFRLSFDRERLTSW